MKAGHPSLLHTRDYAGRICSTHTHNTSGSSLTHSFFPVLIGCGPFSTLEERELCRSEDDEDEEADEDFVLATSM